MAGPIGSPQADPRDAQPPEWWLDRPWNAADPCQTTDLPRSTSSLLELSCRSYHYRGVQTIKNPFDWALYPLLIWELQPQTILEIGSFSGGSALWFGDLFDNFGIAAGHVYSIDLNRVTTVAHPRVTFLEGNGRDLGQVLTPQMLATLPRPWLVIEDADHSWATTIAVLEFFDTWLQPGDYLIVEDSLSAGQPLRALREFLETRVADYEIDRRYCDFFGRNMTWCLNGFLKKLTATAPQAMGRDRIDELLAAPAGLGEFDDFHLHWIQNCLAARRDRPDSALVAGEMVGIRQQFLELWLRTPAAELAATYQGPIGATYRQFLTCGLRELGVSQTDRQILDHLNDRLLHINDPLELARAYLIDALYPTIDQSHLLTNLFTRLSQAPDPWTGQSAVELPSWLAIDPP